MLYNVEELRSVVLHFSVITCARFMYLLLYHRCTPIGVHVVWYWFNKMMQEKSFRLVSKGFDHIVCLLESL